MYVSFEKEFLSL